MADNLPTVNVPSGKLNAGINDAIRKANRERRNVRLKWDNMGKPISVIVKPNETAKSVLGKVGKELNKLGGGK